VWGVNGILKEQQQRLKGKKRGKREFKKGKKQLPFSLEEGEKAGKVLKNVSITWS